MSHSTLQSLYRNGVGSLLAATVLAATAAVAGERERSVLVLTSTNDPAGNSVVVFRLGEEGTSVVAVLPGLPAHRWRRRGERQRRNPAVWPRGRRGRQLRVEQRHRAVARG